MKRIYIITSLIISTLSAYTQIENAHIHYESTDKGVLIPRMTSEQRVAIAPNGYDEAGLMVYDTDKRAFMYWDGFKWDELSTPWEEQYDFSRIFYSRSHNGYNVRIFNNDPDSTSASGLFVGATSTGIRAEANDVAIYGQGLDSLSTGVEGRAHYGSGVFGFASNDTYTDEHGMIHSGTGVKGFGRFGVVGTTLGNFGSGVYGTTSHANSNGVQGFTFASQSRGILGSTTGDNSQAIFGIASGQNSIGVYGKSEHGPAGYFDGELSVVNGAIRADSLLRSDQLIRIIPTAIDYTCNESRDGSIQYFQGTTWRMRACIYNGSGFEWVDLH